MAEAAEIIAGLGALATSTIGNVLDELGVGGLIVGLRPLLRRRPFCGPAVTARESHGPFGSRSPEDFRVGAILDTAKAGDVVVIANGGAPISTWGGLASLAAKTKGIAGTVIDGGARDVDEIEDHGYPVCARHWLPRGGRKRIRIEAIGVAVTIEGVAVNPGDIVVADSTGIAVVPPADAEEVLRIARQYDANDRESARLIEGGLSLSQAMRRFDTI
jgi:regulator of RNase E activity RraA